MDNVRSNHLEELKGSDFQIMDGMPDIQGWRIEDYQGEKVGEVRDMLFDKNTRKVRYIITKLKGDDQEVLIPIGKAQLEVSESKITVQGLTLGELVGLPTYTKDSLTADDEHAIQNVFRRQQGEEMAATGNPVYNRETFYDNESFDQNRFYTNRGEAETSTGITGSQNAGIADDIDAIDDLDRTDRINERRKSLGDDDGPIDKDINNSPIQ